MAQKDTERILDADQVIDEEIEKLCRFICASIIQKNPDTMLWWTGKKENPTSCTRRWEMFKKPATSILKGDYRG